MLLKLIDKDDVFYEWLQQWHSVVLNGTDWASINNEYITFYKYLYDTNRNKLMYDEQRCTSHILRCAQTVRVSSALIKLSTIAML